MYTQYLCICAYVYICWHLLVSLLQLNANWASHHMMCVMLSLSNVSYDHTRTRTHTHTHTHTCIVNLACHDTKWICVLLSAVMCYGVATISRIDKNIFTLYHDELDSAVMCYMGWLRLVGSLKLYVFFAKEPYKRDNILQKRRVILRSLPIVATPYLLWYIVSTF